MNDGQYIWKESVIGQAFGRGQDNRPHENQRTNIRMGEETSMLWVES